MIAAVAAFAVVFFAEMGDKSQIVALTFGARYPARWVIAGLLAANFVVQGAVSLAGGAVGAVVEGRVVGLAGAVLFGVFAVFALRGHGDEDERTVVANGAGRPGGLRIAMTVAGALFVAEIGDKTMFATLTLAAREGVLPVWIGSFLGMSAAGLLGVLAGRVVGERLPERGLRIASASLFLVVGAWLAWDALAAT